MSEQDNKNIINEEPKAKEEQTNISTNDSNNQINPPNEQEQAELSEVETGKADQQDFEEVINFNHTFLNYRIAKSFDSKETLEKATFELLMTNVFIYSGDIIDFKSMTSLSNSEAVQNIRHKINAYKDQDLSDRITFIENVAFYVKTIGYQETVESILPIINIKFISPVL